MSVWFKRIPRSFTTSALHTCALNGVDSQNDGLTATKRDEHVFGGIELHLVDSASVADVVQRALQNTSCTKPIKQLDVVYKQVKITIDGLFDIIHGNMNNKVQEENPEGLPRRLQKDQSNIVLSKMWIVCPEDSFSSKIT